MSSLKFVPDCYRCPIHETDLTDEVKAEVLEDPVVFAFNVALPGGMAKMAKGARGARIALDAGPEKGPFAVWVECPGKPGGGEAHRELFQGDLR